MWILCLFLLLRLSVYTCGVFLSCKCVADSHRVSAIVYFEKRGVTRCFQFSHEKLPPLHFITSLNHLPRPLQHFSPWVGLKGPKISLHSASRACQISKGHGHWKFKWCRSSTSTEHLGHRIFTDILLAHKKAFVDAQFLNIFQPHALTRCEQHFTTHLLFKTNKRSVFETIYIHWGFDESENKIWRFSKNNPKHKGI